MEILQNFVSNNNGKFLDFDGKYGNQCVDLARCWIKANGKNQPGGVSGAKDLFDKFEKDPILMKNYIKIKNTPLTIPKAGDIVIWNGSYGPYGHVAVIIDANLMSFRAFSQNDPAGSCCAVKKYSYNKVSGFLRFK